METITEEEAARRVDRLIDEMVAAAPLVGGCAKHVRGQLADRRGLLISLGRNGVWLRLDYRALGVKLSSY